MDNELEALEFLFKGLTPMNERAQMNKSATYAVCSVRDIERACQRTLASLARDRERAKRSHKEIVAELEQRMLDQFRIIYEEARRPRWWRPWIPRRFERESSDLSLEEMLRLWNLPYPIDTMIQCEWVATYTGDSILHEVYIDLGCEFESDIEIQANIRNTELKIYDLLQLCKSSSTGEIHLTSDDLRYIERFIDDRPYR